jgi:alpha-glucosidase
LQRGGIRWVHVGADAIAFLRETRDERLLVSALRAPTDLDLPFTDLDPFFEHPLFSIWRLP